MGSPTSGGPRGSTITPSSSAAARLLPHVQRDGLRAVARELGWEPATLSRLIAGERRPTYDQRAAVLARYRIAMGGLGDAPKIIKK